MHAYETEERDSQGGGSVLTMAETFAGDGGRVGQAGRTWRMEEGAGELQRPGGASLRTGACRGAPGRRQQAVMPAVDERL